MSEQEFNQIFSRNLNHYLSLNGKTQLDLARYIGASASAVSAWCRAVKTPRMDKVDKMCEFFGIKRADLMEDRVHDESYYLNKETADAAQKIFKNKELRLLFDTAQDADKEDIEAVHSMLLALKRKERGPDD